MSKPIDSVAVVSGGLDSVTLLHYAVKKMGRTPLVLSFNYGQKHIKELLCASEQATMLGLQYLQVDMGFYGNIVAQVSTLSATSTNKVPGIHEVMGDPQPSTYVPNRNMIFLSLAAGVAESVGVNVVFVGVQLHDIYGYWDTTTAFMRTMNEVLRLNRKNSISFEAPFVTYGKAEEIRIGTEIGVDYSKTWSCYNGGEKACGRCPTCAERLMAFKQVGLVDPIEYA